MQMTLIFRGIAELQELLQIHKRSLHTQLAKRCRQICPTMCISKTSQDLYFEGKHEIFHIFRTGFSAKTWTFDNLGSNLHVLHSQVHSRDRKIHASNPIAYLVTQKDLIPYSFGQRQQQALQSISRQMADTTSKKANLIIYIRKIYNPAKQGEPGDNMNTYVPESLVNVNCCKAPRMDFFGQRYFLII